MRIGFGKADSAPATPSGPNSGGTHSSHFLASNSSLSAREGVSRSSSGDGGIDAQLQSTPTRALWIGSIPSTTTPATILSVFSPFGPIESARVLTHKNCGFGVLHDCLVLTGVLLTDIVIHPSVNFERLDDAVRARKALNGRDVLGSDVGAIRIGFARVPVKSGAAGGEGEENTSTGIQGVGDLSVGATIHALRAVKGASAVAADQQVLGGAVENYRSNLLLSMLPSISNASYGGAGAVPVTEQQLIMKMLGDGPSESEVDLTPFAGMFHNDDPPFPVPRVHYLTILQNSAPRWHTTPQSLSPPSARTRADGMHPSCENCARDSTLVHARLRRLTMWLRIFSMARLLTLRLIGLGTQYVADVQRPYAVYF